MKYERQFQSFSTLSDDELLQRLSELMQKSRRIESELVAHIGEVDARRLYAREAAPSMFAYCTDVLNLSEPEAYLRISVARASRAHPVLLEMLADGRLHLSGIAKLSPYLTEANREKVLARAAGKSKRQIEELVAEISPKPDAPATMRKLPEKRVPGPNSAATPNDTKASQALTQLRPDGVTFLHTSEPAQPNPPAPRPAMQPLSPAKYKIQFTASAELRDKLERLRSLMRSAVPDGDLAAIIDEAVTEKLARLEAKRFAKTKSPRKSLKQVKTSPKSRYIPAPVRRAVRERDEDQCAFVDTRGRRCTAREGLEFHHKDPYARGGEHSVDNLQLMCRAHNGYLAEQDYGKEVIARHRRANRVSEPGPVYFVNPKSGLTFQTVHGYFHTLGAGHVTRLRNETGFVRDPLAPRGRGDGGGLPGPG